MFIFNLSMFLKFFFGYFNYVKRILATVKDNLVKLSRKYNVEYMEKKSERLIFIVNTK